MDNLQQDQSLKFVIATQPEEFEVAKELRKKYFFGKHNIEDPYTWTFNHADHKHFVMYKDTEIIGYAHIQFFPQAQAVIRIIVIKSNDRNNGYGKQMLLLIEKWLKEQGVISIHAESTLEALGFYKKLGYNQMSFPEVTEHAHETNDVAMGKLL